MGPSHRSSRSIENNTRPWLPFGFGAVFFTAVTETVPNVPPRTRPSLTLVTKAIAKVTVDMQIGSRSMKRSIKRVGKYLAATVAVPNVLERKAATGQVEMGGKGVVEKGGPGRRGRPRRR